MKTWMKVLALLGCAALILFGIFYFRADDVKGIGGICIGSGAGLFSLVLCNIWNERYMKKHPQEARKANIEFCDERNTMIRMRAKAKTSDIVQWCVMGVAYVTIAINAPLWLTLLIVCIFVLKNVMEAYLMAKYQKEY